MPSDTRAYEDGYFSPDDTFDRVSRTASELGISRSEFFTRAAQRYLDDLEAGPLTGRIDSVLERLDGADDSRDAAVAVGRLLLGAAGDE